MKVVQEYHPGYWALRRTGSFTTMTVVNLECTGRVPTLDAIRGLGRAPGSPANSFAGVGACSPGEEAAGWVSRVAARGRLSPRTSNRTPFIVRFFRVMGLLPG